MARYSVNKDALVSQYGDMLKEVMEPATKCDKCGSTLDLERRGIFYATKKEGPTQIKRSVITFCDSCITAHLKSSHKGDIIQLFVCLILSFLLIKLLDSHLNLGKTLEMVVGVVAIVSVIGVIEAGRKLFHSKEAEFDEEAWIFAKQILRSRLPSNHPDGSKLYLMWEFHEEDVGTDSGGKEGVSS